MTCSVFGQRRVSRVYKNYQEIDMKKLHFGFTLGVNYMDYNMSFKNRVGVNGSLVAELAELKPGFSAGVIGELRLNNFFALRTTPGFIFGGRKVTYVDSAGDIVQENYAPSILLEVPLLMKFFAKRYGNTRGYLIGGFSARYDVISEKDFNPKDDVFTRNNPLDFSIELGVGFDWYLQFFKLSTELRLSLGLTDVLNHDVPQSAIDKAKADGFPDLGKYTNNIDRMTSQVVSILFHFE